MDQVYFVLLMASPFVLLVGAVAVVCGIVLKRGG